MKLVIQEVVNRADWRSGNSLSVILKGTGGSFGRKYFGSYDGSAANAPKLVIVYTYSGLSGRNSVTGLIGGQQVINNTPIFTGATTVGSAAHAGHEFVPDPDRADYLRHDHVQLCRSKRHLP